MWNLAPESEPWEEARQIQLKMPSKDPQHLLDQLCIKGGGQESVQMSTCVINYLQVIPELAGSCVQTSNIMTTE